MTRDEGKMGERVKNCKIMIAVWARFCSVSPSRKVRREGNVNTKHMGNKKKKKMEICEKEMKMVNETRPPT
jgi:hypothetical protein